MFNRTTDNYVISTLSYETLQVSLTQRAPPPFLGIDKEMCVVGSCNGLVCLHNNSYYEFNAVIWNSATKETKVVPKSNLPHLPGCYRSRFEGIGFGFDAKTNDYKIINLLSLYDPMSDEVFLKTPLPDDVIYYNRRYFSGLNESIAMAISIYEQLEMCFDIWSLLEVGVKDSWT
jgi:hypothetical protein